MATIALMLESDGPGGAETMLLQLAQELRRRGHEVVPVGPANGCGWLADEFRNLGFRPQRFVLQRPLDPACLLGMVRMLREQRVDVVHSHEFTMAFYGAAAARILRKPHVITMHGGMEFAARRRRRIALRWAFRQSSVAVVSEPTRAQIAQTLGVPASSMQVVPNGIAFQHGERERVRRELGLQPEERLILAVGNLYPVKGHRVLLQALASMLDRVGPPWRVAIAGRGGEEDALRSFAQDHGFADRLHLLGYRADVPDLLAACDIYVMPSFSEGLPMALIEAMFAGKAIVASAVGGIPDVLRSGKDGLLVPPGTPEALAVALDSLLDSAESRALLGVSAARRASVTFDVASMATAYEQMYLRSMEPHEGGRILHRSGAAEALA